MPGMPKFQSQTIVLLATFLLGTNILGEQATMMIARLPAHSGFASEKSKAKTLFPASESGHYANLVTQKIEGLL
jgi:peptidoglycan biosynthesis protein MviN/MurJ (putative lipid II flippase)